MKPMLAGQFIPENIFSNLPLYGQPKLDGIRMFVKDGVAYTRSLKPVRSEWVQKLIQEAGSIMNGLDGEIIAGDATAEDAYRRTNSSVMSYSKPDDITFHVFDHWEYEANFANRLLHLNNLDLPEFCKIVETRLLNSLSEITEYEDELLSIGHEGMILRSPREYYKYGRGTPTNCELIKLKKFLDTEAKVTGFVELLHNENTLMVNELGYAERSSHQENLIPAGTLGAVLAEGVFQNGKKFKVRVGTGFDAKTRKEIWDNQTHYIGKLIKFKYFPGGVKDGPRFPVFLGFRDNDDLSSNDNEIIQKQGELF